MLTLSARLEIWIILLTLGIGPCHGQFLRTLTLDDFIVDTLKVEWPDSQFIAQHSKLLQIIDNRDQPADVLAIRQIEIFKFIPVDQVVQLPAALEVLFSDGLNRRGIDLDGKLSFVNTTLWIDSKPFLDKGLRLNAYTTLHDTLGLPAGDWLWEIRVKKIRHETEAALVGRLVEDWIGAQAEALLQIDFNSNFYPYLYRRQLLTWTDFILFEDGFGLNVHLTFDFPADKLTHWTRGSPGIYYRRTAHHESIAMGGLDQRWYRRLNKHLIAWVSGSFRFGFNNFDRTYYRHLDIQNLLFLQLASQISVEYRPVYHRGLFGGIGMFNSIQILPEILDSYEPGLAMTLGLLLP